MSLADRRLCHTLTAEHGTDGRFGWQSAVVLDVGKETKFLCSDGHMEEWKMRSDDDAKVKDGEEAVVIYSPSTHEMFTERKEVMNKICGI